MTVHVNRSALLIDGAPALPRQTLTRYRQLVPQAISCRSQGQTATLMLIWETEGGGISISTKSGTNRFTVQLTCERAGNLAANDFFGKARGRLVRHFSTGPGLPCMVRSHPKLYNGKINFLPFGYEGIRDARRVRCRKLRMCYAGSARRKFFRLGVTIWIR